MQILLGYDVTATVVEETRTATYRAIRSADGQPALIKALHVAYPTLLDITRIKHEHQLAQMLDSPYILKVQRLEKHHGVPVLVLEDFAGEPLHSAIPAEGLDIELLLRVAIQLCRALEALNEREITHKNIHPGSILFDRETGRAKLTDFSIASRLPRESQTIESVARIEGPLAYMSPEQTGRMNRALDHRTDFYSLGATLYQMLTGRPPFLATDLLELVHCHIARRPTPPEELRPGVPAPLSSVVMRLLAKAAEDRYQSARGLRIDLETCLAGWSSAGEIAPFPTGRQDRSERLQFPQKLYGRDAEVAALTGAFERVARGATEIVLVHGYSGVGKSTLVNELHRLVVGQTGSFLSGKFDQFNRGLPYSSLIEAFRQSIRQLLTEDEARLSVWRTRLGRALGPNGQIIVDVIPELELVLGQQPAVPQLGPAESQNRFRQVFQSFIQAFAQREHLLVLFLDDLQWADAASLDLLRYLSENPASGYLLLIGAYRDNEVTDGHPLGRAFERLQVEATRVTHLALAPLCQDDLTGWLVDVLSCTAERAGPLASLLASKTHGNPFFVMEFLKTLHQERLLVFDPALSDERGVGAWRWDMDQLRSVGVTDNVVDLLVGKLQRLPLAAQSAVKLAACVGGRFDSNILSIVFERSPRETADALWEAVQAGLILPTDQSYKLLLGAEPGDPFDASLEELAVPYEFLHDRVQQAAYSLIPDQDRKKTHLDIGRLLRRRLPTERVAERLFEVVNHLNAGAEVVRDTTERQEIAQLDLTAGRKAKASAAYEPALRYLAAGTELVGAEGWSRCHELTFALHLERAECDYLMTRFADADERFALLLRNARTDDERVAVHTARVTQLLHLCQYEQAVETGLLALQLLGIRLSSKPHMGEVLLELAQVRWKLRGRQISELSELPDRMTPEIRAAMGLLITLWFPAYLLQREQLIGLIILKLVQLSLTYGNTEASSFAFACFGMFNSSVLRDPRTGAAYGKLALVLARKFNDPSVTCRTLFVIASFLEVFSSHLREALDLLAEAIQCAVDSGNLVQASYCMCLSIYWTSLVDTPIAEVTAQARRYLEFGRRTDAQKVVQCMQITLRWTRELQDADPSALRSNEHSLEPDAYVTEDMQRAQHLLLALQIGYLFERHDEVVEIASRLEAYKDMLDPSSAFVPHHAFYRALAALSLVPDADGADRRRLRGAIDKAKRILHKWAEHSAVNARHKYALVLAEEARVEGRSRQAARLYDDAISAARKSEYLHDVALACERAALFHLNRGKPQLAGSYLQEARGCYLTWGAHTKVRALDEQYPVLLMRSSPAQVKHQSGTAVTVSPTPQDLDLTTVVKASQVLSSEIMLGRLLDRIMQIMLENAGAEKGVLLIKEAGQLVIEAKGTIASGEVTVLQSIPMDQSPDLPHALVNYVARTRESVVLRDAARDERLVSDPYVVRCQPRSVLCAPLVHQGQLVGVLYLENNLITDTFTSDRLKVLRLLSSQVAISIENARLYNDLERKVDERTEELKRKNIALASTLEHLQQTQQQLIQAEKMASLGNLTAGVAHELKNPLNFVNNFADLSVRFADELVTLSTELHLDDPHSGEVMAKIREVLPMLRINANKIAEHGKRANAIVNNMLLHSRVLSGVREPVNLNALVEKSVELAMVGKLAAAPALDVVVEKEFDASLPPVEVMDQELARVIINLVNNALYSVGERVRAERGAAAEPPRIRVSTRRVGSIAEIRIWDNGTGIPELIRERIFDPFFTTKPNGQGTGLGLSICYEIVRHGHGGAIRLGNTEKGRHAEFIVELPVRGPASRPSAAVPVDDVAVDPLSKHRS
ncbi:AAA family ATPase [Sorangium sp. So ce302]|uniref:AAA family ATPase n=1 Tax=Sorangium sp. So ce302 TaxID=3133297 RepID=UPI003F5E8A76